MLVLVLGATGLVGSNLLKLLIEDSSIERIVVLVRNNLDFTHPKVSQVQTNFDLLNQYSEHFKVDHVFCCLGTTIKTAGSRDAFKKVDFIYVIESGKLAKLNGVKSFGVVSSMGANAKSRIFYNRVKGEMENALIEIGFETLQIFRPSLLLGNRKEFRRGEKVGEVISRVFSFAFIKGLKKYKPIHANLVAKSMLISAKNKKVGLEILESNQMNV